MSTKRSIFEEVSEAKPAKQTLMPKRDGHSKAVTIWLYGLFALTCLIVIIGGLTRLTDSGLSITEWDLIKGVIPPMNEAAWQTEFAKYQQTQEFAAINFDMSLEQFKGIFWWEWGHRQLGRFIGLYWAIGFVFFYATSRLRRDRIMAIFLLGILIGLQGVVGILMVKTGYIGARVDVASYALAAHLGMAFAILSVILWNAKLLARSPSQLVDARRRGSTDHAKRGRILAWLLFLQIILGALVAGIDGGRSYTDWPLMGGEFFSSDAFLLSPWWKNLFENPTLVQFLHRINAYLLGFLALWFWLGLRRASYKEWRFAGRHVLIAFLVQITFGIYTLISGAPLIHSIIHQALAILLWWLTIAAIFSFTYPKSQSIRG